MNRILSTGVALAAGVVLASPASAFLIDGFDDGAGQEVRIHHTDFDGGTQQKSNDIKAISDTDFVGANRLLTAVMTGHGGTGGIEAEVGGGRYAHSQASGVFGYTQVDWFDFEPVSFEGNMSLLVTLLSSDLGGELIMGINGDTVAKTLPEVTIGEDEPYQLAFAFSEFGDVDAVESMSLRVDGSQISDLDVAISRVEVAAPGIASLFGLGLLALGAIGRRRHVTA